MDSLGSSMIFTTLLQLVWFIVPAIGLAAGIYATNNFKCTASSYILIGAILELAMAFIQTSLSFSSFSSWTNSFDLATIYMTIGGIRAVGGILFAIGILQLLKKIKSGYFDQGMGIKGNKLFF